MLEMILSMKEKGKKKLKDFNKLNKANAQSSGTTWKENFVIGHKFPNSKMIKEMITRKQYEVGISKQKVEGNHTRQYAQLRDYCLELKSSNPNITIKIKVERLEDINSLERKFKRVYVCLSPLKDGFKARKRDFLGLDGCFLSGTYLGWILTAVGVDPNNGIYPLAYAIVESENKDSWKWFLDCIGDNLDLFRNSNFTFISDRQKGVIPAIAETFSSVKHRKGCDVLLNNTCDVLNKQLVDVKDKHVITCLEFTKEYLMKRIVNVQKVISKSDGPLTPNPAKLFKTIVKDAGQINEKSTIPNTIVPLKVHPQIVGIPKKKERRVLLNWLKEWLEENKFSRAGKSISCIKCKGIGHNQRRCTNDPYASDPKVTQTQQSSQAPTATQASQTTPTTST
ncbi:mutator type transposase [Tanacetum coccineum]